MKASIDRFEGDWAVLDADGKALRRRRDTLSPEAREGDVVDLETGQVDAEATRALLEEVKAARAAANRGKPPSSGNFDL
ncbi:MAG: hypothetical protein RL653_2112 [Pseudomonadota bacterium]|jgi:hypothetical protein